MREAGPHPVATQPMSADLHLAATQSHQGHSVWWPPSLSPLAATLPQSADLLVPATFPSQLACRPPCLRSAVALYGGLLGHLPIGGWSPHSRQPVFLPTSYLEAVCF